MNDELEIPACLDLRNPDVAAKRERDRQAPVTALPVRVERQQDMDAESQKFWEAEQERERIEKENALAAFNAKKKAKTAMTLRGRWDSGRNAWITPEQDLVEMAEKARKPNGDPVTVDELRAAFAAEGATFGKHLLAQIDEGKLALETEKSFERMKRKAKRRAKAETIATVVLPKRRRVA